MAKKFLLVVALMLTLVCVFTSCEEKQDGIQEDNGIIENSGTEEKKETEGKDEVEQKHEHKWSEWQTAKKATCTEDGVNTRICDNCGESQNIIVYAEGHKWSEWQTAKKATCTEDGVNTHICDNCGENQNIIVYAEGHKYGDWLTSLKGDCLTEGMKERVCSICEHKEEERISARGYHSFSEWTTVQEFTCYAEGKKERTCECGAKEEETIPISHNYVKGTCSECGDKIMDISLPAVPLVLKAGWRSSYNGTEYSASVNITDIRWEAEKKSYSEGYRTEILLSAEVTRCVNKDLFSGTVKIYDSEGYLVKSSIFIIKNISSGDRIKDHSILSLTLDENESYTVEITAEFEVK